jgi:hypothetical protein
MTYQFMLRANGYHIVFNGIPVYSEPILDTTIEFHLHPNLGDLIVKSVPTFIRLIDLKDFLTYFEEHISHLQQEPDFVSEIFISTDLGFQAQAYQGDILPYNDGDFSLSFMVNVGIRGENADDTRVYIGGEALITVHEVQNFVHSVQLIIEELEKGTQDEAT